MLVSWFSTEYIRLKALSKGKTSMIESFMYSDYDDCPSLAKSVAYDYLHQQKKTRLYQYCLVDYEQMIEPNSIDVVSFITCEGYEVLKYCEDGIFYNVKKENRILNIH